MFPYKFYDAILSRNSLWAKINQSVKFILDNLDTPDGKYITWRQSIEICRKDEGIMFKWIGPDKDMPPPGKTWYAIDVEDEAESTFNWKTELFTWMDDVNSDPVFEKKDLNLAESDQKFIIGMFENNPGFRARVTQNGIKIIRTNEISND
jgi:hypothetical protein